MSAKRVLVENVARTRVGATSVPADEGPVEGDLGGNAAKSDPKLTFIRPLCLHVSFKNVLPTEGGEQILQKMTKV